MPRGRFEHVKKHHASVWKAMQRILKTEQWEATLSDAGLAKALRDTGVYSTPTITRNVRMEHNTGNFDERKVKLFAKQHRAKANAATKTRK